MAARPRRFDGGVMERVTICVPTDLMRKLKARSRVSGVNISRMFVVSAYEYYLSDLIARADAQVDQPLPQSEQGYVPIIDRKEHRKELEK